jgi:mRNA interferase MazF
MVEYTQGDIYWVNIPQRQTEGSEQFGARPFLIVSRNSVNKAVRTVVVVPLSSTVESQPAFRIVIPVTEFTKEVGCQRTFVKSVAKVDQLRVIDKSCLTEKVGKLSQTATVSVLLGIAYVFDNR